MEERSEEGHQIIPKGVEEPDSLVLVVLGTEAVQLFQIVGALQRHAGVLLMVRYGCGVVVFERFLPQQKGSG